MDLTEYTKIIAACRGLVCLVKKPNLLNAKQKNYALAA